MEIKIFFDHDKEGHITSVNKPGERITGYAYDNNYNLTGVTDAVGRKTVYTYDLEQNLTSITDASGRTEKLTYDAGSRRTSYTMNGGNSIRYDYDALNDLVEKTYQGENGEVQESIGNTVSEGNPSGVLYGYDLLGQRISMMDTSGDSVYTYDGLGRITSVTIYRKPAEAGADTADREDGEIIRYEYDGCDQLAAIVYADGTRVSYAYDKNDNLTAVTDRNGKTTTYVYDAINRVTEIHRPNGVSTYNTYNARDQIVSLKNTCDECGWVVSQYDYTYDDNGYIATEKAVESLYDYAWDDKHNGWHEDGRHDDKMPHGTKHNGKHDKDSEYRFQLVETDREFTYDENGRLLSSKEQEENSGLTTYDYTYDKVGNRLSYVKRTQTTKHPNKTDVAESAFYQYNDSNQLVSAKLFDGKKNTIVDYTYDENGNLTSEIGKYGTDQVETYYDYTVENRLQAVYDADRLLMAAAYDGDGNRVFQLNYNLHTDEDWKDNSGNGNGNNKDNAGSGNNGNGNSSSGNNGNSGNGKGEGNTGNTGNGNSENNGNDKENSKSEGTDDAGYGNATNAEEHNSQNQSGILFPAAEEISRTETDLIAMIKTTGKDKDYELIEYILNVNTQYTQVLMELNENGAMDAVYTYGTSRLTEDRFTGESNFYLYDPAGNVAGITDQNGYLWQSYRYDAFGNATFGSPQYDNEYTFNAESYNPNIQSQYLRARYYDMVKGNFLTEDSYLGNIREPLTLNRYSYCVGNPLFYSDPSGHSPIPLRLYYDSEILKDYRQIMDYANNTFKDDDKVDWYKEYRKMVTFYQALQYTSEYQYTVEDVIEYDYDTIENQNYIDNLIGRAHFYQMTVICRLDEVTPIKRTYDGWLDLYNVPTIKPGGEIVEIPLDRPRGAGTSWKSEEPAYLEFDKELGVVPFINGNGYQDTVSKKLIPYKDSLGIIRVTDENGISRYCVGVGLRVMDPDYSIVGSELLAETMKYGTKFDIVLRDSNYNVYYVPAVVGDGKKHTLSKDYPIDGTIGNGIYQTGISWSSGKDEASKDADAAVIEFMRDYSMADKDLMSTPEFDILSIIVYRERDTDS